MKKKLLFIQNMKAVALEQSIRKKNGENKEIISVSEYKQKLQKLLENIAIQTKYTNRVSQCHLRNVQELQNVKQQLHHLLELRKIQQQNDLMLKKMNDQLSRKLVQTQQKLVVTANQIFQLKIQIKKYKKEITQKNKIVQKLQFQLQKSQREKYHSMIELYDRQENKLISTLVEDYVKEIKHPSSIVLYKHCVQTLKNKNFNNFLKGLEVKMNSMEIQNKDSLRLNQAQQLQKVLTRRKQSNLSLLTQSYTLSNSRKQKLRNQSFKLPPFRIKTQGNYSQPKNLIF